MYDSTGVSGFLSAHPIVVAIIGIGLIVFVALLNMANYHDSGEYKSVKSAVDTDKELAELIAIEKEKGTQQYEQIKR